MKSEPANRQFKAIWTICIIGLIAAGWRAFAGAGQEKPAAAAYGGPSKITRITASGRRIRRVDE